MEDRKNVSNQGGQGQGNKPGQGGSQKPRQGGQQGGNKPDEGSRDDRFGRTDKPTTRPSPSGVPNEGRRSEGQHDRLGHGAQERQGGYKGGRQETGGIPNPDDRDDDTSAGSFRGTADQRTDTDDERDNVESPGRVATRKVNRQKRNSA
jgi:translation initiation factor IF-2